MASSSNSEFQAAYDIFLSFRGADTRKKFTDHLYHALIREGFKTFRDNEGIERGEYIKPELQRAIWSSSMSVIVLSETYATSKSCLFEIQTIFEHRKKKSDHVILPVFYEVEPGDIKEQAEKLDFGEEKVTEEEVKGWSTEALKEVANIAGKVYKEERDGYETKLIDEIIGELKGKQANKMHLRDLGKSMKNLKRELVFLSSQEEDINSEIRNAGPLKIPKKQVEVWLKAVQLLKDDTHRLEQEVDGETNVSMASCMRLGKDFANKILEVQELQKKGSDFKIVMIDENITGRLVQPLTEDFVEGTKARNKENIWECLMKDDFTKIGVYGMGGIGKTTTMKYIHNLLLKEKDKFDKVYWITVSKEFDIRKLQSNIAKALDYILRDEEDENKRATELYAVLSRQKRNVLILDDVWERFDLDSVGIPEPNRSNGCKLLLTTRSLEVCVSMKCTPVKVDLFTEEEALTLFLRVAVGNDQVFAREMEEIAFKIVKKCARLPRAIVTIAGSLRGSKEISEWQDTLNGLISSTKDTSNDEIFIGDSEANKEEECTTVYLASEEDDLEEEYSMEHLALEEDDLEEEYSMEYDDLEEEYTMEDGDCFEDSEANKEEEEYDDFF